MMNHISLLLQRIGVVALLMLGGCSQNETQVSRSTESPSLTETQMRQDLTQYHDAIVEAWAYHDSPTSDQVVDVGRTRDRLLAQVSSATTPQEFALLLREFAASLKDGHSEVILSSVPEPLPFSWPIGFLSVREGIIVANLNWLAENPGVELGDLLSKVDGQPIEDYLASRQTLTSASTDLARRSLTVDRLHWSSNQKVELEFIKQDGSILTGVFRCIPERLDFRKRKQQSFCEYHTSGDFAIITIPSFTWNNQAFFAASNDQEREEALAPAKRQIDEAFAAIGKAPGLILDLRDNDGGLELLSSYVAEHLVAGDFTYFELQRRGSKLLRSKPAYQGMNDHAFDRRMPERPRSWRGIRHYAGKVFDGPLIVLINERCFSTTDNLCAFLQDTRNGTKFVGRPTHGGTGEPALVDTLTNSGAQIQFCVSKVFSPKGRLIEGNGTTPDVTIESDRECKLQNRDSVLEAALELLEN